MESNGLCLRQYGPTASLLRAWVMEQQHVSKLNACEKHSIGLQARATDPHGWTKSKWEVWVRYLPWCKKKIKINTALEASQRWCKRLQDWWVPLFIFPLHQDGGQESCLGSLADQQGRVLVSPAPFQQDQEDAIAPTHEASAPAD